MDIKLKVVEIRDKFPIAYRKIASWYTRQYHKRPFDDSTAEAMFTVAFGLSGVDVGLLRQFLKDAGISFQICGGPALGYDYYFQGDEIPMTFPYYSEESAILAGLYISLCQVNT